MDFTWKIPPGKPSKTDSRFMELVRDDPLSDVCNLMTHASVDNERELRGTPTAVYNSNPSPYDRSMLSAHVHKKIEEGLCERERPESEGGSSEGSSSEGSSSEGDHTKVQDVMRMIQDVYAMLPGAREGLEEFTEADIAKLASLLVRKGATLDKDIVRPLPGSRTLADENGKRKVSGVFVDSRNFAMRTTNRR